MSGLGTENAGATVAVAYRQAEARAPIAEALDERFGAALHEPIQHEAQQWWTTGRRWVDRLAPLFRNYELVYGSGQFTWAGLWTISDPPEVAHAELAAAWELEDAAISRWRLPVLPEARVLEGAAARRLGAAGEGAPPCGGERSRRLELPGPNQQRSEVSMLAAVGGQRAARTEVRRHLVPDWRSVADHYDGVHLSWAGRPRRTSPTTRPLSRRQRNAMPALRVDRSERKVDLLAGAHRRTPGAGSHRHVERHLGRYGLSCETQSHEGSGRSDESLGTTA